MSDEPRIDLELLQSALRHEAEAQRALLAGEDARPELFRAVNGYRGSFDLAPPSSWGRLIGMAKAAILSGDDDLAADAARVIGVEVPADAPGPPAAYARALAALITGEDDAAVPEAGTMREGSEAFGRAADAVTAVVARDASAFTAAIQAIVDDFAGRSEHVTGVAIADTALMFERLAAPRGLRSGVESPLFPA